MSLSVTIVQQLPFHIVEAIIDYARANHDIDYEFDKQEALSIIHSCQSWRSAFLRRACSTISFTFDIATSPRLTFYQCPAVITPLNYAESQHVRCLSICSGSWEPIMDGSILTWMLESGVSDLLFPLAENLIIRINDLNPPSTFPEKEVVAAIQNIEAFLQHIRRMAPNIKTADITWYNFVFSVVDQSLGLSISSSVVNVLRGVRNLSFAEYGSPTRPTHITPEHTSGLTHLAYKFNDGHTWFTELVRHNAGTLESLKTVSFHKSHFESLLHDSNLEPVIYPFLKLLKLERVDGHNPESAVPNVMLGYCDNKTDRFPSLETFFISGDFPFVDNVFIPGKNSTLRHLSVFFHGVSFMQNNSVFQKYALTKFCNLNSICLSGGLRMTYSDTRIYDSQIEFLRSTLACSTNVKTFKYLWNMDKYRFFQEAQTTSIFQTLHILNIQDIVLSFSDIVLLLRSATFLQNLECGIDNKAPKIDGVGPSKLPSHISNMHPLNKLIRDIKLNADTRPPIKYIAKTAILLAISCSRLSKIGCLGAANIAIRNEIDNISKTKPFGDYTEQCRFISSRIHY